MSGRALLDPASVPADVLPRKVTSVGTYAMIVDWSDGHGTGIYTYGYLRGLGGRLAATVSEDV
jgi:ATP-binding protein involved in chromosome partitioning